MPQYITPESAFLHKVAQACLGRPLIFRRGIVEETTRLIRTTQISSLAWIVQFSVPLLQQVSDRVLVKEAIEETTFITLCVLDPVKKELTISILHSLTLRQVRDIKKMFGWHSNCHLKYGYVRMKTDEDVLALRVRGGLTFIPWWEVNSAKGCDFLDKVIRFAMDEGKISRRLC